MPTPEAGYGSSAPPINLPAPVTGRLTLTSPDANYASLVIGDSAAVPANTTVMAVNDTQEAASVAWNWITELPFAGLMDFLVSSAEAEPALPGVCAQPYRACGTATAEGAFEFALTGKIGDLVSISIIDATTGAPLSEATQRVIPPNVRALPRRVNHVGFLANINIKKNFLYSLMSATGTESQGLVEIRDLTDATSVLVPFDGPSPQRLEVNNLNKKAGVIDVVGQFAAFVDLETNKFNDLASSKAPITNPTDVALSYDAGRMAVSANPDAATFHIMEIFDTSSMSSVDVVTKADLPPALFVGGGTVVETSAVVHGYFNTTKWVDLYAFIGLYMAAGEVNPKPYVGMVTDDGAGDYTIAAMAELPAGCLPKDVVFDPQSDLMVACGGINQVIRISAALVGADPVAVTLMITSAVGDPNNLVKNPLHLVADCRIDGKWTSAGSKMVYLTVQDGDETHADSVLTMNSSDAFKPSKRSEVGLRPTGMAIPYNGTHVFVSTEVSHSVTTWTIDELK